MRIVEGRCFGGTETALGQWAFTQRVHHIGCAFYDWIKQSLECCDPVEHEKEKPCGIQNTPSIHAVHCFVKTFNRQISLESRRVGGSLHSGSLSLSPSFIKKLLQPWRISVKYIYFGPNTWKQEDKIFKGSLGLNSFFLHANCTWSSDIETLRTSSLLFIRVCSESR